MKTKEQLKEIIEDLESQLNETKNELSKLNSSIFKTGDKFFNTIQLKLYMIARIDKNTVQLIQINNGNRWGEKIIVHDCNNITLDELHKLCNSRLSEFKPVDVAFNVTYLS